jgi:hypothetical protein
MAAANLGPDCLDLFNLAISASERGKPRKMLGRIGRINSLKGSRFAARRSNRVLPRRLDVSRDGATITRRLVMINLKKGLASLAVGIALTALASPSYAQERGVKISPERAQAIHQCSVLAARYPQYLWGNQEIYTYRACMTEHGQQE